MGKYIEHDEVVRLIEEVRKKPQKDVEELFDLDDSSDFVDTYEDCDKCVFVPIRRSEPDDKITIFIESE